MEKAPLKKGAPAPKEELAKKRPTCLTLLGGFLLGLLLLFLLSLAAVSLAVAATGLFEVPVLSNIIKPPPVEEDFSYQKVSPKKLAAKTKALEGHELLTMSLTDDELNTILNQAPVPSAPVQGEGALKSILVKFSPGVIKIFGVLNQNEAPFYLELRIEKTKENFEFAFQKVRVGALPLPGGLATWAVANFLGFEAQPLTPPKAEDFPAEGLVVGEGKITIKKLDLRALFGQMEE